jgi:hypothetical protein
MSNPAPKNIYDLCNEVYARHGQYAVFDFVGQFDNIKWTWCEPCEASTPFDPYYDHNVWQEDLDTNEAKVCCLVCGSTNEYVDLEPIRAFVLYADGTKAIQNIQKKELLEFMQKECDGYVEAKSLPSFGVTLWFNEDVRHKALQPNFNATKLWIRSFGNTDNTVLLGNVVITATETDKYGYPTTLTAEQLEEYMGETL